MDAQRYYALVKTQLQQASVAQAVEMLKPLAKEPTIQLLANRDYLNRLTDNGLSLLESRENTFNWQRVAEGFAPLNLLTSAVKTVATGVSTGMLGMFSMQALTNKDLFEGTLAELNRLKNPKLLLQGEVPLFNAALYPFKTKEVSLTEIQTLLEAQINLIKGLRSFLNSSRFHIATSPNIDLAKWMEGVKALGLRPVNGGYQSETWLFGNTSLSIKKIDGNWEVKATTSKNPKHPIQLDVPAPLTLAVHLRTAKKLITEMWGLDQELSKSLNDVYDMGNHAGERKTKEAKLIEKAANLFYSTLQGSTLELALSYAKSCDALSGKMTNLQTGE